MNQKIEISIILFSKSGREIDIHGIKEGDSFFDENVTPDYLWESLGGIEIFLKVGVPPPTLAVYSKGAFSPFFLC